MRASEDNEGIDRTRGTYIVGEQNLAKPSRQPRYVPGLRNIFLFFALVLLPACVLYAWFDSTANHLDYSWHFAVAFAAMFLYGVPAAVDLGRRVGAAYVAIGFLAIIIAAKLVGENPDTGQIVWGMVIGWFSGMAASLCFMWLRFRRKWNAEHPYMRC
jgi:hypothetical protein